MRKISVQDIIRRLVDAVRRNRPEKQRTSRWSAHHDNAPAHRPVLVISYLGKKNTTTLEHTPQSPELVAAGVWYNCSPQRNSTLKEQDFCDATDII
jgi:hypothetical protein